MICRAGCVGGPPPGPGGGGGGRYRRHHRRRGSPNGQVWHGMGGRAGAEVVHGVGVAGGLIEIAERRAAEIGWRENGG